MPRFRKKPNYTKVKLTTRYLNASCLYCSITIMSAIILGTSTAFGQPVFPGSLLETVLKKDPHTKEDMLSAL